MRDTEFDLNPDCELSTYLLKVCRSCEPEYTFNGIAGYLYDSVKDSLDDFNLSKKHYRKQISDIGRLHYLKDEDFNTVLQKHQSEQSQNTQNTNQKIQNKIKAMFGFTEN